MLRQTLVIGAGVGGTFSVDIVTASGTQINRQHGAAVVSGMQAAFTPSCPPPPDGGSNGTILGYSATATTFTTMQTTNAGVVVVDVYKLR
jgi:hypothetical protein